MSWSRHISYMVAKARNTLSWVFNVFKTLYIGGHDNPIQVFGEKLDRVLLLAMGFCSSYRDSIIGRSSANFYSFTSQRTFTSHIGGLKDLN